MSLKFQTFHLKAPGKKGEYTLSHNLQVGLYYIFLNS